MSPTAKGLLAFLGVAAVSVAVVVVVLKVGNKHAPEPSGAPHVAPDGSQMIIDNGQSTTDPLRPDYRVEQMHFPPFSQMDQDERTVTNDVFSGKLTVVSFFFTRCTFICPALTGAMLELMDHLKDTPARFVSFSVDPAHDTPAVVKAYAQQHNADLTRWTLLSGTRDQTWTILRAGLKWGIEERPEERIQVPGNGNGGGTTIANIRHPGWFALVGPDSKVLGIYQSSDDEQLKALETRIREALKRMK